MPRKRMRMGELARRSGIARETIHYYLREGLLPKPLKGGRTVAYYDESHLERLRMIRTLREEKYLPLAVIRRMLDVGPRKLDRDFETLADVLSIDPAFSTAGGSPEAVPDDEAGRVAAELGLLGESVAAAAPPDPTQARVLAAVSEALSLEGDARQLTLDDLRACARELSRLVDVEAGLFFDLVIRTGEMARSVSALRVGRAAVARFITAYRDLMLRRIVEDILTAISGGVRRLPEAAPLPLGPTQLCRLAVEKKQTALRKRAEGGDAAAANDLAWHLFVVAPPAALGELSQTIRALLRPRARVLVHWSMSRRGGEEAGLERLVRRAAPFALGEVLLAEARLRRLLSVGPETGSFLDEVVAVLHRLFQTEPQQDADPLASACAYYRRALIGLALPRVLGRHSGAVADLRRAVEVIVSAPGRMDAAARLRVEGNARLALGRSHAAAGDWAAAERELERVRAMDSDGPLGLAAEAVRAEAREVSVRVGR